MMPGALVGADGIVGITEAHSDAQALEAGDAQLAVHHRVPARRAGADRVVVGEAGGPHEGHHLVPAPRGRAPAPDQIAVCRLRSDVQTEFDSGHEGIAGVFLAFASDARGALYAARWTVLGWTLFAPV
jgi:hypothetical protein